MPASDGDSGRKTGSHTRGQAFLENALMQNRRGRYQIGLEAYAMAPQRPAEIMRRRQCRLDIFRAEQRIGANLQRRAGAMLAGGDQRDRQAFIAAE